MKQLRGLGIVLVLTALAVCLPRPAAASSSGGAYTLETAIGPGTGAESGYTELRSCMQPAGTFLRQYAVVEVSAFKPQSSGGDLEGTLYGVPVGAPVQVTFGTEISTQSLAAATKVTLIYDRMGARLDVEVPYELTFDTATGRADFLPQGGWLSGSTYRVEIGAGVVDLAGSPVVASLATRFQSNLDFSLDNVVRAPGNTDATLAIPAGAFGGSGFVLFNTDPLSNPDKASSADIQDATAKAIRDIGPGAQPVAIMELNAYGDGGVHMSAAFDAPVLVNVPYPDNDRDGLVDGTGGKVRTSDLSLWTLDEKAHLWVRVPGSSIDTAAGVVSAPLPHFSVYAVMAAVDTNVESAYAYPVPWRPYGADPARYGTLSGGITFVNLPQAGRIRVYTLSGLLVREQELTGALNWVWDGKNKDGENAASGTYLWIVESGGNRKTGKLMVIR